MSGGLLPVAPPREVGRYLRDVYTRHPGPLLRALAWYTAACAAALAVPPLLGRLVEAAAEGGGAPGVSAEAVAVLCAVLVLAEAGCVQRGRLTSRVLGERVLARLREDFVRDVLALPLADAERAGTGDLLTRTSRDVDALSRNIRFALPEMVTATLSMALTLVALLLVNPLLFAPCLVSVPVLFAASRWYLRRAPRRYLEEGAAHSRLNDGIAETADGARTVDALRRGRYRVARTDADIADVVGASIATLNLRSVWLPSVGMGYFLPLPAVLLVGGLLYSRGWASVAEVTAAALYAQQLAEPVNRLAHYLNDVLVGYAALARLRGVPRPRPATGRAAAPDTAGVRLRGVRFGYTPDRDVLDGIDLDIAPGERIAVIGPSGAGKSTLGRVVAGVNAPTAGTVALGGVPLDRIAPDRLRRAVALVPQEHHVFTGTLRDNLVLPRPDATDAEVRAALRAVAADRWVDALPEGIDTAVGASGHPLTPAQAQQTAMARLLLAAPRVLVLDEATSLIDLGVARSLERSLTAVAKGRTIVAIAHRLHTAHDADRIAVVDGGAITELGTHRELLARGGTYARLWRAWSPASDAGGPSGPPDRARTEE
jgi:ABC-type multidrug transport system fused ATPase/permease subunit